MPSEHTDLDGLVNRLIAGVGSDRILVAVAGPPGVGKSTFSAALREKINRDTSGLSEILPMDGYHYDDIYLDAQGWKARKGAPHTFDTGGFRAMLARLKANDEAGIFAPVFDRKLEIARAGAHMIKQQTKIIIIEGNYLLLAAAPWNELRPFFDVTVMLDTPMKILKARLRKRWTDLGYSTHAADEKVAGNDLINVKEVVENSIPADFIIETGR